VLKGLCKNSHKVCLELNEMIHQIGEEAIENLESSVNLDVFCRVNEHEQQVEQVLPHKVLLLVNSSTNLNQQVANLVDDCLVLAFADGLEQLYLNKVLSIR